MIEQFFSPQLVRALGWTLVHTLWQGALFALLLGLALVAMRRFSSQARYTVAIGLLGVFLLSVVLTFLRLQGGGVAGGAGSLAATDERGGVIAEPQRSNKASDGIVAVAPAGKAIPAGESAVRGASSNDRISSNNVTGLRERTIAYYNQHLPLIVTLWLLGVLVLQLRLLGQLAFVQRLKNYGTERLPSHWAEAIQEIEEKLRISRPVRYLTSYRIDSPLTVGWLRPVVLFPTNLLAELREPQILAILAHELAHVKRHDFAVNLLQKLLCTLFFYHPGVWWMSTRIEEEREHCCDDLAIELTGQPVGYARTLIQLKESELTSPQLAMAVKGPTSRGFTYRVHRLFSGYLGSATYGEGMLTSLILVVALALTVMTGNQTRLTAAPTTTGFPLPAAPPSDNAELPNEEAAPETDDTPVEIATEETSPVPSETGTEVDFDFDYDGPFEEDVNDDFDFLMKAIYDGELRMVKYFLEKVSDLDQTDEHGFTPLMAAAHENEVAIARLLIQRGADVNYVNRDGWTALIEAADEGSLAVAQLLVESGATIDNQDGYNGRSAIGMAASEGHLEILRYLNEQGAAINEGSGGVPPLHLAANEGHWDVVEELLSLGAEVDALDSRGRTPLMHAASEDQPRIVERLLKAGADPARVDDHGRNALLYAVEEGNHGVARMLTENLVGEAMDALSQNGDLLVRAAREGELEMVRQAIEDFGIDVNTPDQHGNTALSLAAREGEIKVVRYLLGLKVNLENGDNPNDNCAPLFLAAREDEPEIIRLLATKGADVETTCSYQETDLNGNEPSTISRYEEATPLLVAVQENHHRVIRTLVRNGANVNCRLTKVKFTHKGGNLDWQTANRLNREDFQKQFDLDYEEEGWTPLMEAVDMRDPVLVQLLLDSGADKKARTDRGLTAASLAERLGEPEILALIR